MKHSSFTTMWTPTHFPAAMRSLNPTTREKAIELANQMVGQGNMDKQQAVQHSVLEARRWARERMERNEHVFTSSQRAV